MDFEELIERYRFEIVDGKFKILEKFNKINIINKLEEEFKQLVENNNANKKYYISGLTEEYFIAKYPNLSTLLSNLSDDSFKNDKNNYISDFAKLSKTSINKIFEIMRENKDKGIDIDLIYDFLLKTPNTKISKGYKKREHKNKSWKNKSFNPIDNKNIIIDTLLHSTINEKLSEKIELSPSKDIEKVDIENILNDFSIDKYNDISEEEKYLFCSENNLNIQESDLVKKLCYEKDEDILFEVLEQESLLLRFVILIYTLNLNNRLLAKLNFQHSFLYQN